MGIKMMSQKTNYVEDSINELQNLKYIGPVKADGKPDKRSREWKQYVKKRKEIESKIEVKEYLQKESQKLSKNIINNSDLEDNGTEVNQVGEESNEVEQLEGGNQEDEESNGEVEQLEGENQEDEESNGEVEQLEEGNQEDEEKNEVESLRNIIPESRDIEDIDENSKDKKTKTVKDKIIKLFLETPRKEFLKLIGSVENENFGLLLSQILEDYLSLSNKRKNEQEKLKENIQEHEETNGEVEQL